MLGPFSFVNCLPGRFCQQRAVEGAWTAGDRREQKSLVPVCLLEAPASPRQLPSRQQQHLVSNASFLSHSQNQPVPTKEPAAAPGAPTSSQGAPPTQLHRPHFSEPLGFDNPCLFPSFHQPQERWLPPVVTTCGYHDVPHFYFSASPTLV